MNSKTEWDLTQQMMGGRFTKDGIGDSYIRVPDESALRSQVQYFRKLGYMVNKQDRHYAVLSKPGIPGIVEIQTIKGEIETGRHANDAGLADFKELARQMNEAKVAAAKSNAAELVFEFPGGTKHFYWDGGRWGEKPNSMAIQYGKRSGVYKAKFKESI